METRQAVTTEKANAKLSNESEKRVALIDRLVADMIREVPDSERTMFMLVRHPEDDALRTALARFEAKRGNEWGENVLVSLVDDGTFAIGIRGGGDVELLVNGYETRDEAWDAIERAMLIPRPVADAGQNERDRKNFAELKARLVDSGFGVCPKCHKTDGYINVGKSHWFFCKEHKVRWRGGINLFSSWRDQSEEDQRKIYDALDFSSFKDVESHNTYDIEKQGRLVSAEQYKP